MLACPEHPQSNPTILIYIACVQSIYVAPLPGLPGAFPASGKESELSSEVASTTLKKPNESSKGLQTPTLQRPSDSGGR